MLRILKALVNSWRGLVRGVKTETALRQEVVVLAIGAPLSFVISSKPYLLIASLLIVIVVESLNTAIEEICDKINPEHDSSIEYIKDLGSLSVTTTIFIVFLLWFSEGFGYFYP